MTFAEKETVMRALRLYQKQQGRRARNARKTGNNVRAERAEAEAGNAGALLFVFGELLTVPAGEAKI